MESRGEQVNAKPARFSSTLWGDERKTVTPQNAFYTMSPMFEPGVLSARPDKPLGETAEKLWRGELVPNAPIGFYANEKGAVTDWTVGGSPVLTLVSQDLVNHLKRIDAKGWSTYPVSVRGATVATGQPLYGLSVSGRCGAIDKSKRRPATKKLPWGSMKMFAGLPFESTSWDGSDLFLPAAPINVLMLSERVASELRRVTLKNVDIIRAEDYLSPI